MPKKWINAQVISIKDLSSSVKEVVVRPELEEPLDFKPGQFLTFDLPIGEKRLDRWRSYSIANAPKDGGQIELIVSYLQGGRASEFFFKELQVGDQLTCKKPAGQFVLPEELEVPVVMICTGTGVAPFKSMIEDIVHRGIDHPGIHLIFGTRYKEGILYREYFEELEKKMDNFKYSVALSREEYKGYQGYVHGIYKEAYKESHHDISFYLCGWQNMIDQATEELLSMGYEARQIVYELYG